ncbi:sugar phosphate isomerase/epimerase family protein [Prosthecobacter sp.]|uniref:sugar phosphate isomerase/epimerase family protein n=1 Tax=Prosthecobacter sp. TaxID=1965333 RepID=UPI001D1B0936|nr:sugar phosphate isomerase/epimerase family protein [Prosthecobacter sp.]MCB1275261.1 sugar phosphate isomerase/epimerase [Prosthecobacter sp.]
MNRRRFLQSTAALGAVALSPVTSAHAGQFTGRIRKSLKWSMAQKAAKDMSLAEAFKKLRACGYDGIEPSLLGHVTMQNADEWTAASRESGLIIDGTVGGRSETLEAGIDLTKKLGGDSMLVVLAYPQEQPIQRTWNESVARMKSVAPHAEKQGIKVLIENVWNTFLISAYDMARFIDEVGSPWVQVHFDIGNMMRWGVAEHWAQVLGKRSQKLDVKEYDLAKAMSEGMRKGFDTPLGEGSINWPAVREALAQIQYTGWAAAEVKAGDWDYLADVAKRMDRVLDI